MKIGNQVARLISMAGLTLVLGIAAVLPVDAAGNGATLVNQPAQCTTSPNLRGGTVTFCNSAKYEFNSDTTPSGTLAAEANGTLCTIATYSQFPESNFSLCERFNYQNHVQDGVLHESGQRVAVTIISSGQKCIFSQDLHFANGQFQFNNSSEHCN